MAFLYTTSTHAKPLSPASKRHACFFLEQSAEAFSSFFVSPFFSPVPDASFSTDSAMPLHLSPFMNSQKMIKWLCPKPGTWVLPPLPFLLTPLRCRIPSEQEGGDHTDWKRKPYILNKFSLSGSSWTLKLWLLFSEPTERSTKPQSLPHLVFCSLFSLCHLTLSSVAGFLLWLPSTRAE